MTGAETPADARVTLVEDVVYGTGGGRPLHCDIYRPPPAAPAARAAVILVHGGSWRHGDRTQLRRYGWRLGRLGYVCVAIEYRLIPETWFPGLLEDVKASVRWVRANARQLDIDPERVAIHGNSAGGHLALLAAGTPDVPELEGTGGNEGVSSAVSACVSIYGPTVFHVVEPERGSRPVERITQHPDPVVARQASPLSWVTEQFPPTLLLHGTADELVPVEASERMYDALRAAGVPVELHVFPEQPHAFDATAEFARHNAATVGFFLDRYLRQPAAVTLAGAAAGA